MKRTICRWLLPLCCGLMLVVAACADPSDLPDAPSDSQSPSAAGSGAVDTSAESPLWIVKDGQSAYALVKPESFPTIISTIHAANRWMDEVESRYGAVLPLLEEGSTAGAAGFIRLCLVSMSEVGDWGYRIEVVGEDVHLYAADAEGFDHGLCRILADAAVENGLCLPRDYAVEVFEYGTIPETQSDEPETERPVLSAAEKAELQEIASEALLQNFPELAAYGLESFRYRMSEYDWRPGEYRVFFTYILAGKATGESYDLTYVKENGAFKMTRCEGSYDAGRYTQFHNKCTPEMMEAAKAKLRELSGDDSGYLEVNSKGELVLSTEVIVSITPPEGESMDGGCGIDHEHKFYSVVICS